MSEWKIGDEVFVDRNYVEAKHIKNIIDDVKRLLAVYPNSNRIPGTISWISKDPLIQYCADVAFECFTTKREIILMQDVPMINIHGSLVPGEERGIDMLRPEINGWVNTEEISDYDYYKPLRIIYNNPATIVFWRDGTKTIVKKNEKERYNSYNAFCAALAKKIYGTNSEVKRIVRSGYNQKMAEGMKKLVDFKKKVEKARKAKKEGKKK